MTPSGQTRRSFLRKAASAGAAGAALALGPLLGGCDLRSPDAWPGSNPEPASPAEPAALPIARGNEPISPGLRPERDAVLRVAAVARPVSPLTLAAFARQYRSYGCRTELTTFATMSQALAALGGGRQRFDVLLGATVGVLPELTGRGLLQPLSHGYITNIGYVWRQLRNPFYDRGWRYTVPYTVYTTGLAWRKDLLDADPYTSGAGWAFPWQARFRGKVAILDDYREALGLGLLAGGVTDLNTTDPRLIDLAGQALIELADLVRLRASNRVGADLASGAVALHQARSGDAVAAARQLRAGVPAEVIGYWFPPSGRGPVGTDTAVIPRAAASPVLAHLFLNYLLDPANALANARRTGYQPPLIPLGPGSLLVAGALPPSLVSAAVIPTFFDAGLKELALPGPVAQLWRLAWAAVPRRG